MHIYIKICIYINICIYIYIYIYVCMKIMYIEIFVCVSGSSLTWLVAVWRRLGQWSR